MSILNIFATSPAFEITTLTDAIQSLKFVPGRISELGIFTEKGIPTTTAAIEERGGILVFVPPSPRGGPGMTVDKLKRTLRVVSIPHFQIDDTMMAEEVQGVRAWGQETAVEMLMEKVAERGQIFTQSFAQTEELARLGAIKGLVTYADGTTLDLRTLFNVTAYPTQFLNLLPGTPTSPGTLRRTVQSLWRLIADELGGLPFSGIRAFCGNQFFDDLIQAPDVRTTYLNWQAAAELRGSYGTANQKYYAAYEFGGITWENYRGFGPDGTPLVPTDLCYLIPEGVPGLFQTYRAPADYIETVNTNGQRMYVKQYPMPNDKGINMEFQMNALSICTRPRLLLTGSRLAS